MSTEEHYGGTGTIPMDQNSRSELLQSSEVQTLAVEATEHRVHSTATSTKTSHTENRTHHLIAVWTTAPPAPPYHRDYRTLTMLASLHLLCLLWQSLLPCAQGFTVSSTRAAVTPHIQRPTHNRRNTRNINRNCRSLLSVLAREEDLAETEELDEDEDQDVTPSKTSRWENLNQRIKDRIVQEGQERAIANKKKREPAQDKKRRK